MTALAFTTAARRLLELRTRAVESIARGSVIPRNADLDEGYLEALDLAVRLLAAVYTETGCAHLDIDLVEQSAASEDVTMFWYQCGACETRVMLSRFVGDEPTDEEVQQAFEEEP